MNPHSPSSPSEGFVLLPRCTWWDNFQRVLDRVRSVFPDREIYVIENNPANRDRYGSDIKVLHYRRLRFRKRSLLRLMRGKVDLSRCRAIIVPLNGDDPARERNVLAFAVAACPGNALVITIRGAFKRLDGNRPLDAEAAVFAAETHGPRRRLELLRDAEGDERKQIFRQMADEPSLSVEPLVRALADPYESFRGTVCEALATVGGLAVPALIKSLGDERAYVRSAAARTLGLIGEAEAVEPLLALLDDDNSAVANSAWRALVILGNAAVPALVRRLASGDRRTRRTTAWILSDIGGCALSALEQVVDGGDEQAAREALWTLSMIRDPEAERILSARPGPEAGGLHTNNSLPPISVIVCTYNRLDVLRLCLEALERQDIPTERFEVLVVDNNSSDGTGEWARPFAETRPWVRYILEEKQGLSPARNRGIAEARGDLLVFLDDDAVAEKNYLREVLKAFQRYPDICAIGGKAVIDPASPAPPWMKARYPQFVATNLDLGGEERLMRATERPQGVSMAFRRRFFESYGMFKENLGRRGKKLLANEEEELIQRARQGGEEFLYLPQASVIHLGHPGRLGRLYMARRCFWKGISDVLSGQSTPEYYRLSRHLGKLLVDWPEEAFLAILSLAYKCGRLRAAAWKD